MPIVENHSVGIKDLRVNLGTAEKPNLKSVSIPASNGEMGPARIVGSAEVSDEILAAMKDEPWMKHYVGLGANGGLVITSKNAHAEPTHKASK